MYEAVSKMNLEQPCSMKDLLNDAGLTEEEYITALNVAQRKTTVVMKRSPTDFFINNYNPVILKCLK